MKGFFIAPFLLVLPKPLLVLIYYVFVVAGTAVVNIMAHQKFTTMLLTILIIAGIAGFAIFYQAIKFFEKI